MVRWRYLRWWVAALVVCILSFLSMWLPQFFPGEAGVFCGGPASLSPSEMQSGLERVWERLREPVMSTLAQILVVYALPAMSTLLSGAVAARAGRRLSTAVGALAVSAALMVALDLVFAALDYYRMLNCAGWDGKLPWFLWQFVPVLGNVSAAVLLIAGIRTCWRMGRDRESGPEQTVGRS
ncbi:hypothetical protein AB0392_13660 [Nonomuraea angiospora]|uniref:hypothetical protein n=1 Tax=Nonomuraea angiospora TaxID=46172 RepID=UPI0034510A9D